MATQPAWRSAAAYVALLGAAFLTAALAAQFFGAELDNYAYDAMLRAYRPAPWTPESAILEIDERTLQGLRGGIQGIRGPLAEALRIVNGAHPKTVAVDLTLADRNANPAVDAELAAAMRATPRLTLASDLLTDGWEDPLPEFTAAAAALGHVHAAPDSNDEITRAIPLEKAFPPKKRWALSLEAFRLFSGASSIVESPQSLQVGAETIPVPERNIVSLGGAQSGDGRLMRIRFVPPGMAIPRVSMAKLLADPALAHVFTGRAVFIGVTAITEVRDRLTTPVGSRRTTGIEINAEAFETLAQRLFLTDVNPAWVWLFSLALAAAIGFAFRLLPGWWAYAAGIVLIVLACVTPYLFFTHRQVFSFAMPAAVSALSFICAAAYYHLVTRRDWRTEFAARERYQQAMHFVTHEMRTPLSAIQGSSELISNFPLTEEKRKQVALVINAESKRLARMVAIFLDVERLSAGQMELKREPVDARELIEQCVARAAPLAERKQIAISIAPPAASNGGALRLYGDRELLEYACYNLLTNAVKYSPRGTQVIASAWNDGRIHIAIKDQGIGMDEKEVRQIFRKFYRTARAQESGETGVGLGLSIVQQIVERHGGEIGVASKPGEGSRFTMTFPAAVAPEPALPERR